MLRQIGPPEIILILVVLILLFGAKRLPDAARSLGRSMRIFKSEVKEMREDGSTATDTRPAAEPRPLEGRVERPEERRAAAEDVSARQPERRD